jgi:hypothetical protein
MTDFPRARIIGQQGPHLQEFEGVVTHSLGFFTRIRVDKIL